MRPSRAVSVAVFLGTGRGWQQALGKFFGSKPLSELLQPSIRLASRGFTVDSTYRQQTLDNLARFRGFTSMRETFLKNGQTPAVGSTFRNPDLAATYGRIANEGDAALYSGQTARAIVDAVRRPPVVPGTTRNVRPGLMRTKDLADYRSVERAPTVSSYRGLQVYGMGAPSSGGSTVGEALNIVEGYPRSVFPATTRSTTISRPRDSRSPTGVLTSEIQATSTCPLGACSPTASRRSAVRSSRRRRRRAR